MRREDTEYVMDPEKSREQCHTLANVHIAQCPTQVPSFQEPIETQLVKIKGCWRLFGLMMDTINITGAWQEVTNYIKSSWKKLQLVACQDLKGFGESKAVRANVPCQEHISTGSMLKWVQSEMIQLLFSFTACRTHQEKEPLSICQDMSMLRFSRCINRSIHGPELGGREVKFGANMTALGDTEALEIRDMVCVSGPSKPERLKS